MPLLLALAGAVCVLGGLVLIAAPLRFVRLEAGTAPTHASALIRGVGLLLVALGAFLVAGAFGPQRPVSPRAPTPTPIRRMV